MVAFQLFTQPTVSLNSEKPRLSLQKLRRTRIGTNTSTHRPSASLGSVGAGALEKAIFHGDEIGSGNDTESRASSSYGIRTLFSHLHTSAVPENNPVNQTHEKLQKLYTKEELRDYQQMFQMFDTDGSGALGNVELKEAMISIGLQASEQEIDELIREVDEDGNGEIDFEEFCHCMKKSQNRVTKATNEEVARQCFEVFDQDGNGLITESEFIYVAKEIGGFSHELAEYVFHELDISSNGHLSSDQFSAIVKDYLQSDTKST
uniref:EF-hand domain-containing protein n=1 Tax=Ditylenchus dipsaci TaxID=166011 RepID=A0A915DN83_9BILA